MPTATLSTRVDEWLYTKLAAGVTAVSGRVHGDGPDMSGMVHPFADFLLLSSLTILGVEGVRILQRLVYQVEIVAEAESYTPLQTGADQVYTTLHQHAPDASVAGIVVLSSVCEEEVRRTEVVESTQWRYLGWRVRLEVEST